jgi:Zn-dependent peptidase ImmA (M78 family)
MPSITGQYVHTLGASEVSELRQRITRTLKAAIDEEQADRLPVKLSDIAARFDINPAPRWDASIRDGRLLFDDNLQRFVVLLGKRGNPSATAFRWRFTYAHEVAHRFFFIRRAKQWERAADVVSEKLAGAERVRAQRILYRLEEDLCDQIAGDLLVPQEPLLEALSEEIARPAAASQFAVRLDTLSKVFAVSRECVLVQLKRALAKSAIETALCAMVCEISSMRGEVRSIPIGRARIPMFPRTLAGSSISAKHSGLALRSLGEALEDFFRSIATSGSTTSRDKRIRVPLRLETIGSESRKTETSCVLDGWWSRLDSKRVLIWGELRA